MSKNCGHPGAVSPRQRFSIGRLLAGVLVVICAASWTAPLQADPPSDQPSNRRCLICHGQSDIATQNLADRLSRLDIESPTGSAAAPPAADQGPRPALYVTSETLSSSPHAKLSCLDCHPDAKKMPHGQKLEKATCDSRCHPKNNADFMAGSHGAALARHDPQAPTCVSCHGGHDIRPKSDPLSRTYPLNIARICGDCHKRHLTTPAGLNSSEQVAGYMDSVHGKALERGLIVSATCADCHGNHTVLPVKDPRSAINRTNIAGTCGRCHVGIPEVYRSSIHGQEMARGNKAAPVCSDCHTAHNITRTDTPAFKLAIVTECGECHDKPARGRRASLYETYRESYHGQVNRLGATLAARCSDCHGAHDIRRVEDPQSRLSPAHRLETCRHCHQEAAAGFEKFEVHADPQDAKRFPVLNFVWWAFVYIMLFSFGFFGLHCLLWFIRQTVERIRRGPPPNFDHDTKAIKRFTRVQRLNHAFMFVSFFGLALTGLPLLYSDKAWGQALCGIMGGPGACGIIHRICAVILLGNLLVHFVGVFRSFRKNPLRVMLTGPTTLLPRWQDAVDCAGMFRWFLVGGAKPTFDHWTYFEKFDYFAATYGSLVIGLSGLLLWFPVFFSKFLPGSLFNVASMVHGHEALLAVGYIFTIHFFNAHLRIEKFPVDDVIFTGRVSEEEFKHDRGQEYARLIATGELEALRTKPSSRWFRKLAIVIGIVAMTVGTVLVVMIILASLGVI